MAQSRKATQLLMSDPLLQQSALEHRTLNPLEVQTIPRSRIEKVSLLLTSRVWLPFSTHQHLLRKQVKSRNALLSFGSVIICRLHWCSLMVDFTLHLLVRIVQDWYGPMVSFVEVRGWGDEGLRKELDWWLRIEWGLQGYLKQARKAIGRALSKRQGASLVLSGRQPNDATLGF